MRDRRDALQAHRTVVDCSQKGQSEAKLEAMRVLASALRHRRPRFAGQLRILALAQAAIMITGRPSEPP
ncbi:hypothetical protein [Ottowia testudinis]|uniref:Uncharacterized protein n=1 Tax=Ottowia testudinis TaxID=2816950 RepID=A0A975CIB3_9BURK|nr:hypothetical protein [Ottowia testudinis]QTD46104.1 hypothetical protein J1M35_04115 [Ottowia testudinis]